MIRESTPRHFPTKSLTLISRDCNPHPFKFVQESDKYMRHSTALVVFLLRLHALPEASRPLNLHLYPPQEDAICALEHQYATHPGAPHDPAVVHAFHRVLSSLIHYEFPKDHTQWKDPLGLFLAASQIRHDGSFYDASHGTPLCSGIEFTARVCQTYRIHEDAPDHEAGAFG
jgi:hypothetical protein